MYDQRCMYKRIIISANQHKLEFMLEEQKQTGNIYPSKLREQNDEKKNHIHTINM